MNNLEAIELSNKCMAVLLYYTEVLNAGPCFGKVACAKLVAENRVFKFVSTAPTFFKFVLCLCLSFTGSPPNPPLTIYYAPPL
jgi:hypothetical protein